MNIKAYSVLEEDEYTGGIVFAKSSAEARRVGSSMFGTGEFNWGKARRLPWADRFAGGEIPVCEEIAHGWHFECSYCGAPIPQDDDEDDFGWLPASVVRVGQAVYCSELCRYERHRADFIRKNHERAAIAGLSAKLLQAIPGITLTGKDHAYVSGGRVEQCIVAFRFPGCVVGDAHYRVDGHGADPTLHVRRGDIEAFESWRRTSASKP